MATQITFTNDVTNVSSASNGLESGDVNFVAWHVYEREVAGVRGVYVRRELGVGGGNPPTLEAEQKIIVEGNLPKITFDAVNSQWIVLFTYSENVFYITFTENEAPSLQPALTETPIDHFRPNPMLGDHDERAFGERIPLYGMFGIRGNDAYNGPALVTAIEVGASTTPGNVTIRWRANPEQYPENPNSLKPIIGFNVYRALPGQPELLGFVPYTGLDPTVYEFDTLGVIGEYFVTQLNYKGFNSTEIEEGRGSKPGGIIFAAPDQLEAFNQDIFTQTLGPGSQELLALSFVVVETAPIIAIVGDTFLAPALGEGFEEHLTFSLDADYQEIAPIIENDTLLTPALGRGYTFTLTQTGFGSVIIT